MIHVIGDSHVMVFSGKEHIPDLVDDRGFLPFFTTYRLGQFTAYNVEKKRSAIEAVIKDNVKAGDAVLLSFGEIDCRAHLVRQSELQQRSLEDVVRECVKRYSLVFDIQEKFGVGTFVWNVPPSNKADTDYGEYVTYGTGEQRDEANRLFNEILEEECQKKGIGFVSILDHLRAEDGSVRSEYYADQIHLSQRAMPSILSELRKKGLLEALLEAEPLHDVNRGEKAIARETGESRPAQEKGKILLCCGADDIAAIIAARPYYDACFIVEADRRAAEYATMVFGNDERVKVFHAASVNLLDFCRQSGIDRIETLRLCAGADSIGLLRTIDRFIKKKKIRVIDCTVPNDKLGQVTKMLGDAYDPPAVVNCGPAGGLSKLRCTLRRTGERSEASITKESVLINIVYAHLKEGDAVPTHRGNVSVVWSPLPLENSDVNFYINAYSFAGRQNGLDVLYLAEPSVVLPGQYNKAIWSNFDYVLTHYDPILEGRKGFVKMLLTRSGIQGPALDGTITENRKDRDTKYPIAGRNPGICMINGNKSSVVPGELYSKRKEAASWFCENSDIPFAVFGNPPFSLPNFKGVIPPEAKLPTLAQYKYGLAFENVHDPVFSCGYVDKILSCLETRTVPVYLGADNIDFYVPRECFIDFRSFKDYRELEKFIKSMSEQQYLDYVEAMDAFVAAGRLRPYSWSTACDQLVRLYADAKGMRAEEVCDEDSTWEVGLPQSLKDREFRQAESARCIWAFADLARYGAEIKTYQDGRASLKEEVGGTELQSEEHNQREGGMEPFYMQAEMDRLQNVIQSGFADVNDYYRYAQLLIMARSYDEAIPVLTTVVTLFPAHSYALNDLAVIYFQKEEFETALWYYRRAFNAEPGNANVLRNLLNLLQAFEKKDEMMSVAAEVLRKGQGENGIYVASLDVLAEFNLDGAPGPEESGTGQAAERPAPAEETGTWPFMQQIRSSMLWEPGRPLRLHLGCGEQHLEGYINIDYPQSHHSVMQVRADIFADLNDLDFPPESVDEIRLHHVFEHFNRVKALALLIKWHGWLKTRGVLYIETPDLFGCAQTILSSQDMKVKMGLVRHLTGDQSEDWAYHVDQWFPERFVHTLSLLGFESIETNTWSWQQEPYLSNVVVTARKARNATTEELLAGAEKLLWESTVSDSETATYEVWKAQLRQALEDRPGTSSKVPAEADEDLLSAQEILADLGNTFPLDEIQNFNQADRDKWVRERAARIPAGQRVLDVGAGTCPYRANFAHCEYKTHDFKKYEGVKLGNTSKYGRIDYESDITDLPVPDASFDVVLCTEVLEHVPHPEDALREMGRVLKPGGRLLLTAPLGSGLHQLPYHYYGGFTPEWYRHFLPEFGFEVREITSNGGFFKLLSQECARLTWLVPKDHPVFGEKGAFIHKLFGEWIPRFLYSLDQRIPVDQFTVGYHVEAVKRGQPVIPAVDSDRITAGRRSTEGFAKTGVPKVTAVVFSKDRAMQLDCTLRSLRHHCRDVDRLSVRVIYTSSNHLHERGYRALEKEYSPSVEFVREGSLRSDVLSSVASCDYVLFLVDDNIFVRDFNVGNIVEALGEDNLALGASLRLGRNTTYCYMLDKVQGLPAFARAGNELLSFDWTGSEYDFGYPLEVSSSLYRASDILPLLQKLEFANPNTLEAILDTHKNVFRHMPHLLCCETSVTFCNPVNKVQSVFFGNRAGRDDGCSADVLIDRFLEGYRVDVAHYSGFVPNSCHQEVEVHLIRETEGGQGDLRAPLASIIILNTNGRGALEACLDSIGRNTPESHEVIVLDNGSTDGSIELLRSRTDVTLIECPENIGVAPGRAKAMGSARGQHIVLLDNDTVVTAGWLTRFLSHISSDPTLGILGPRSNYVSGQQLVPGARYNNIGELEEYSRKWCQNHQNQLTPTLRLVGFCMFIRREVIEKVGNIDATFGKFGFEDDDYTIRANIAGFRTAIANDVFIHHTGGPQGQGNPEYNGLLMGAWRRFKEKWGIPSEAPYGTIWADRIVSRSFDAAKHFIPLTPTAARDDGATAPAKETANDHLKKALSYEDSGETDLAIQELERALVVDDGHAGVYDGLGVLYYRKGDTQKALQMLSRAVMLQPREVGFLKNLAAVALEAGETEDAIGLYESILSIDPEDVDALLVAGGLCEQNGQAENALRFFDNVVKKEPTNVQAAEAVERIKRSFVAGQQERSGQTGAVESGVLE